MARMKPNDPRCPLCLRPNPKTCDRLKCAFWRLGFETKTFDEICPEHISNPDATPPQARLA